MAIDSLIIGLWYISCALLCGQADMLYYGSFCISIYMSNHPCTSS